MHASILLVLISLLILNNSKENEQSGAVSYNLGSPSEVTGIDEVASAEVASRIALKTNLLISDNVKNLSDSLNAQVELATVQESYISKPQIVATDVKTRKDIEIYKTVEGDSVGSVARKFNVTSDTIKWANNLTTDVLSAGTKLTIPPVTGVLHSVSESDTADSIAQKYKANKDLLIAFNDLEVTGLVTGQRIVVPGGVEPSAPAPVYFSTASASAGPSTSFAFGSEALYGGNGYSYGYCTWHAANRRLAIGRPMPRNLGNAVSWASLGAAAGMSVTGTPKAGAILWHKNTYIAGGFGHVAFVEEVRTDGSILVSDMNYPTWGSVTTRIIGVGEQSQYLYID